MLDAASPVRDFYPSEFEVDPNGKRNAWEAVVLLPFIDERRLLSAVNAIDPDIELTRDVLRRAGGVSQRGLEQGAAGERAARRIPQDAGRVGGDDADEDEEEEERGGTEVANASGVEGSAASAEVAVEAPDAVEPRHEGAPTATAVRTAVCHGARYFETRRGGGDAAARHRQAGDGADGDGGGKPAGTQRQPKTPEQKQAEALERLKRLQPFSKKDVRDMERLVVNYGTDFCPDAERSPQRMLPLPLHDWSRFVTRIQAMQFKFPETLEDMFIELMRECYRVLATPRGETGGAAAAAADMLEMEACAAPPDDDED
eukprot:ctg_2144.g545